MRKHRLKIEENWYKRLESGEKTFEMRKHDRDYQVGDEVQFYYEEMIYGRKEENNYLQEFLITHILYQHLFPEGIAVGYCGLSIVPIINEQAEKQVTKKK